MVTSIHCIDNMPPHGIDKYILQEELDTLLFLGKKLVNVGVCPDDSRDYHRRKDGTSKKVHGSGRVYNGENQSSDVKSY